MISSGFVWYICRDPESLSVVSDWVPIIITIIIITTITIASSHRITSVTHGHVSIQGESWRASYISSSTQAFDLWCPARFAADIVFLYSSHTTYFTLYTRAVNPLEVPSSVVTPCTVLICLAKLLPISHFLHI